ncbi:MAG: sigma-54-dependent Fis family transcriptional regulator [Phycisphaerae bacterium]|nr:sigma-54-dependent Fis family transcriptional regulator [Phycisphaerae bacterium]
MKATRVLIIEDEKLIRWSLIQRFREEGFETAEAETGADGLAKLREEAYDLILLDHKLPDTTGLRVLGEVRDIDSDVVVVIMTAYSNVEDAVAAMRLGAYDYLAKPFTMEDMMRTVHKGLETTQLRRQVRDYRRRLQDRFGFDRIIGDCPRMHELFSLMRDVAGSGGSTLFLRGESGTGKDLVAKTVHHNSDRADRPFMNITCTALSENLLESELFGHERGAFTDAKSQKKGLLELADGGTVYLDEIGDMPKSLQPKLLRFLEERAFRRVGGVVDIEVDVRIIAATNRDIEAAVREGRFREDLFYRLNIIPIVLPPLRDRADDIEKLAMHFIAQFAAEFRRDVRGLTRPAVAKLNAYGWPGNVRELRNAIERAVLLSKDPILGHDDFVLGAIEPDPAEAGETPRFVLPANGVALNDVEEELVRQAIERTEGHQGAAAKLLGLSRDQLRYRLQKYGILGE